MSVDTGHTDEEGEEGLAALLDLHDEHLAGLAKYRTANFVFKVLFFC